MGQDIQHDFAVGCFVKRCSRRQWLALQHGLEVKGKALLQRGCARRRARFMHVDIDDITTAFSMLMDGGMRVLVGRVVVAKAVSFVAEQALRRLASMPTFLVTFVAQVWALLGCRRLGRSLAK